jgi:prolipoprotein diacylglyceryl transferase
MYLFAEIPAPAIDSLGFVQIYGITMALGMAIAAFIAHKRYPTWHPGSTDIMDIFLPTVIAGIAGARLYHLFTGYNWEENGVGGILNLRNGGLSIWGAVLAGGAAVYVQARMKKLSFVELGAAIVPGLLVAQAIGRVGNYFNQELFGRPLNAPWALEVDEAYRPAGYEFVSTFHPTFLYEALWCLFLAIVIIICEKKVSRWSHQATIAAYVAGYCAGRTYFEWLRTDAATELFGIRFNLMLSAVLAVLGGASLLLFLFRDSKVQSSASQE